MLSKISLAIHEDHAAFEKPISLSDQAYHLLRADIIKCNLAPGRAYTEQQLRTRYGLTISTARSALNRLSQEGLVVSEARRGYWISRITMRDVIEIFDLRLLLETGTMRLAIREMTDASMDRIVAAFEKGRKLKVDADLVAFLSANKAFHLAIAEASSNERAVRMLSKLLDESERVLHLGLVKYDVRERFVDEHAELLDMLKRRDMNAAISEIEQQILGVKDNVMKAIMTSRELLTLDLSEMARL
jgi:DNA-binding GntR family transcriptional regulator